MFASSLFKKFPAPRFLKFSYVGFEIFPEGFRYAEILNDGFHLRIGNFGSHESKSTGDLLSNDDVRTALLELKKKRGVEYIKATIPEEQTYLFTVEVSGDTDEEIRNSIEFQLEENVPLSGAEALFDFYIIPTEAEEKKTAMVSVIPRSTADSYIAYFESLGIRPVAFMAESTSISRAVVKKNDYETHLIVYFWENKTMCAVVSRGFVQFTSTISLGIGMANAALKKYESSSDGKDARQSLGGSENDRISVIAGAVSALRDEIQRVIVYWQTHKSAKPTDAIKDIILCGKDATLPGLQEYLSSSLKYKVQLADVWTNMPVYRDEVPPIHFNDSLLFAACLGLSLPS